MQGRLMRRRVMSWSALSEADGTESRPSFEGPSRRGDFLTGYLNITWGVHHLITFTTSQIRMGFHWWDRSRKQAYGWVGWLSA